MESFYGDNQPRRLPQPTSLIRDVIQPTVPEVSLLFNKQPSCQAEQLNPQKMPGTTVPSSYNAWRVRSNINPVSPSDFNTMPDKENYHRYVDNSNQKNDENVFKKQVRFENNYAQKNLCEQEIYQSVPTSSGRTQINNNYNRSHYPIRPSQQIVASNLTNIVPSINTRTELDLSLLEPRPPLVNKSNFANLKSTDNTTETYMHNFNSGSINYNQQLPNLSKTNRSTQNYFNDPEYKSSNVNYKQPQTYQDWAQKNITYSINSPHTVENNLTSDFNIQMSMRKSGSDQNSVEPTVSDLYRIVQVQNEQLKALQAQVELLLKVSNLNNREQVEDCRTKSTACVQTDEIFEVTKSNKVSIGLMTSFEKKDIKNQALGNERPATNQNSDSDCQVFGTERVTFDLDKNCNTNDVFGLPNNDDKCPIDNRCEPNLIETSRIGNDVTENENINKADDCSLVLNEPIRIIEDTPTPPATINLEMEEFSTDTSSDDEQSHLTNNNFGITVWNNIVEQVQNILEKSPQANLMMKNDKGKRKKHCCDCNSESSPAQHAGLNFADKVKNATVQYLRTLGINFADTDLSRMNAAFSKYNFEPSDMSIEINQLMLKYLKDDQLSQLITTPRNGNNGVKFAKQANEISISTVRYMEKYNLLEPRTKKDTHPSQPIGKKNKKHFNAIPEHRNVPLNKILDITALKQQPKLL